jgi:(4-O-methyl)-D-glucuronate---lignin esterase
MNKRNQSLMLSSSLAAALVAAAQWWFVGQAAAQRGPQQPAGPPAAVPAEVAIARPSAAEIEAVQASLKKFVTGADPATKAILEKYPDLVAVRAPGPNSAIAPSLGFGFRAKHEANVERAKQGDIDVLFMGDSITDFWRNTMGPFAGKAVFDKNFGEMKAANFGIAGDTTQGVLYRLQNGEGQGFKPKAVMLMIGTNNTGRNTAAEIAEGIGAVVLEMKKDFPGVKILLLAVFPRATPDSPARKTIADINKIISKLDDGKQVFYLDIGGKFLDEGGNIPRDIMTDALHPSTKGYEIWAEAVKEPLAKLLK